MLFILQVVLLSIALALHCHPTVMGAVSFVSYRLSYNTSFPAFHLTVRAVLGRFAF